MRHHGQDTSGDAGAAVARTLLRTAVGGTMVAHGVRHAQSLEGTAGFFGSLGFERPELQARLSAVGEVGGGAAMLLGAGTTAGASSVVGTMAVAGHVVHKPNGFFITEQGWEYVGMIGAASIALAALGPGRFSIDRALGLDRHLSGPVRALIAAALGAGSAAAHLRAFWERPEPSSGAA